MGCRTGVQLSPRTRSVAAPPAPTKKYDLGFCAASGLKENLVIFLDPDFLLLTVLAFGEWTGTFSFGIKRLGPVRHFSLGQLLRHFF